MNSTNDRVPGTGEQASGNGRESRPAHLKPINLEAWRNDVGWLMRHAAEELAVILADEHDVVDGSDVDVGARAASANSAIACASRQFETMCAHLGWGIVPGVGKAPAGEDIREMAGMKGEPAPTPAPFDASEPLSNIDTCVGAALEHLDQADLAMASVRADEAGQDTISHLEDQLANVRRELAMIRATARGAL